MTIIKLVVGHLYEVTVAEEDGSTTDTIAQVVLIDDAWCFHVMNGDRYLQFCGSKLPHVTTISKEVEVVAG